MTYNFLAGAVCALSCSSLFAQNFKIVNANSGKVLEVSGASASNGAVIDQNDWRGASNQLWQIISLGNGYSEIVNVNSGKVLDVTGVSTANGAVVQQWDWLGGSNQQWQILPQSSSYSSIVNLNSGKVLDVSGLSTANGAWVQQWDWLQGVNQQWQIVPNQDTYQATGQTNLYYDPTYQQAWTIGSLDADYSTQYYYLARVITSIQLNGNEVGQRSQSPDVAFGDSVVTQVASPIYPGDT